jgi:hypothetical protein
VWRRLSVLIACQNQFSYIVVRELIVPRQYVHISIINEWAKMVMIKDFFANGDGVERKSKGNFLKRRVAFLLDVRELGRN